MKPKWKLKSRTAYKLPNGFNLSRYLRDALQNLEIDKKYFMANERLEHLAKSHPIEAASEIFKLKEFETLKLHLHSLLSRFDSS